MSIKVIVFCIATVLLVQLPAQPCHITLKGQILDESTQAPLEFATAYMVETNLGASSDEKGYFQINGICPGKYHLQISHIGCESERMYLEIRGDTILSIQLHHHTEILNEISVHSTHEQSSANVIQSINTDFIHRNADKNVADLLESLAGVNVIKNGGGISKPVIHGMYGNRITILNNGLVQAGQQWGNDHAPEIDPFISEQISVIKGAASLAYGGNGLGSVVQIQNNAIEEDPHLHGKVNYIYNTNGHGNTLNAKLQKHQKSLSWKITGTFKLSGDTKTQSYFLTNTGKQESNLGLQLNKSITTKWKLSVHASTFNTGIGILRGSHIGNVTDLNEALSRPVPFFTSDKFSYSIEAPKQIVHHHLVKIENKWYKSEKVIYSFNYGSQWNNRKEFDVRRGDRSNKASLSLNQLAHFIETTMHKEYSDEWHFKSGIQLNVVSNENAPGTGILPLIPNYTSAKPSGYAIVEKITDRWRLETGIRLDYNFLHVASIHRSTSNLVERFKHQFVNFNGAVGGKYDLNKAIKLSYNIGYALRSPEVNELYSAGLHQGVSGIEEGNRQLNIEKSVKNIFTLDVNFDQRVLLQLIGYHQLIKDYIYLKPEKELRLTIRGAFPVFIYDQTDAAIHGVDFTGSVGLSKHIKWLSQFSYIRGNDRLHHMGLVFMPANTIRNKIELQLNEGKKIKNTSMGIQFKNVFRQNNITVDQDFLLPPPGYSLLNFEMASTYRMKRNELQFSISMDNALNTAYRDYLNRLRYFANETGRNTTVRIGWIF